MTLAEVIFPLPLQGTFTYLVPRALNNKVCAGSRVVVQLGSKKIYTGITFKIHDQYPDGYQPKELLDVLDESPIINQYQLDFFQWMASYYMCAIGEVVNAALPAAFKLLSQSFISLNSTVTPAFEDLSDRERTFLKSLETKELSLKEAGDQIGLKHPQKFIKQLSDRGLIYLFEKLKDKYQPKKVRKIRLSESFSTEAQLEALFLELKSKPKQEDVVLTYLREVSVLHDPSLNKTGILKSAFLESEISSFSLKTLIKNGVFMEWEEIVTRLEKQDLPTNEPLVLSQSQSKALEQINTSFERYKTVLFHGVTGSGKTEIYIELIKKQLARGKQVLYLLPEIALTTQIIARLHKIFGNSFGVYHSRYSDNERVEVWQKILKNEYQFVVGVRSAIFLPFHKLRLIIIDEEHEPSYKQFEPSPRYHARDAATYLASIHDSKVLLGTATPSLETYQNTIDGKFGLVELSERYGRALTPELHFVDIRKERKQKKIKGNFSSELVLAIEKALEKKEQVILFQNRRGYASYISCDDCDTIPTCSNCSVSLTYHQFNNKLVCHYCGFNQPMFTSCTDCGGTQLRNVGFGTEELEEELTILFPQAIIQRMDMDTTRNKYGYQRIIEEFEEGNIDILVGTQMVSKGFDFDTVTLVGIFDTDRMIHFPDFRSHERAYSLIVQVSGRAGRKSNEGKVIIQTSDPEQPLLEQVRKETYRTFFQWEARERKSFGYPPFTRLIKIIFKHKEKAISYESATFFAQELRKSIGNERMTGPVEPIIGKIRNQYLHEIILKLDKHQRSQAVTKKILWSCKKRVHQIPVFRSVGVIFDVDPI